MESLENKVVGTALYFELEKTNVLDNPTALSGSFSVTDVKQIVLLPYYAIDRLEQAQTLERVISFSFPRPRWGVYKTSPPSNFVANSDEYIQAYRKVFTKLSTGKYAYVPHTEADTLTFANFVLSGFVKRDLLDYIKAGWTLVNKPFAVDVTEADVKDLSWGKVSFPKELAKRIDQSKAALKYPDLKRATETKPV